MKGVKGTRDRRYVVAVVERACGCGCGQLVPAVDSRGRPRFHARGHHSAGPMRPWSREDDRLLVELSRAGVPDRQIAERLGRTRAATVARRSRLLGGVIDRRTVLGANDVAAIFGVTNVCVGNWIRRGWLLARRSGTHLNRGGWFMLEPIDVADFIRDERYWGWWLPSRIVDPRWRAIADDARRGAQLVGTRQAGRMLGYGHEHVVQMIKSGRLPGVRGTVFRDGAGRPAASRCWYVRMDLVAGGPKPPPERKPFDASFIDRVLAARGLVRLGVAAARLGVKVGTLQAWAQRGTYPYELVDVGERRVRGFRVGEGAQLQAAS